MIDRLEVLFEDPQIIAVAKPADLPTQSGTSGLPTLEAAVRRHLGQSSPESAYLGTVHRLDRPVSGVVLWAKTPKAARRLAGQFEARATVKEYWALVAPVQGSIVPAPGGEVLWEDWLSDSTDDTGLVRAVAVDSPKARRAVTRVRRDVEVGPVVPNGLIWLRLWPQTGRTHQIRAQASLRGLSVLGDARYGSAYSFATGIALHGRSLTFEHPARLVPTTVVAPLPESWSRLA